MNHLNTSKPEKAILPPVTAETPANNDHFQASTKIVSWMKKAKTE